MTNLIYVNVNEEDVPYDKHDNLQDALAVLYEFPNDTIVICYADSPVGRVYDYAHYEHASR